MKNLLSGLLISLTMACQPVYASEKVQPNIYNLKSCPDVYYSMLASSKQAYLDFTKHYLKSLHYGEMEMYMVYDLSDERLYEEFNVVYCSDLSEDYRLIYYLAEADLPKEFKNKSRREVIDIIDKGEF